MFAKATLRWSTATILLCSAGHNSVHAGDIIGLITKTESNPYFIAIKDAAKAKATALGLSLESFTGQYDGDNSAQATAIKQLIADGAKGILLTPNDSAGIVPSVGQARNAGILVITLDSPLKTPTAGDAYIGADNYNAGLLIGKWAKQALGAKANTAKIVTLDGPIKQPSTDDQRHNGFINGFGIPNNSAQIVGSETTDGSEAGGNAAMGKILQKLKKTDQIDVLYAINEPAAFGGYTALKAAGKEKGVTIVTIDGSCRGIQMVKDGIIGADLQQYPSLMAVDGVQKVVEFVRTGNKPESVDTGQRLITDHPVPGVPSKGTNEASNLCWG
jgi:fructose transport system substrate-binding protein